MPRGNNSGEASIDDIGALKALKVEAWNVPGVNIKMVRIPAGKFVMGSPKDEDLRREDETQRTVTIAEPFYISAFEVTQKQFYDLMIPDYDFEGWILLSTADRGRMGICMSCGNKQQGSKGPELTKFAFFDPSLNPRGSKTSSVGNNRKPNAWRLGSGNR